MGLERFFEYAIKRAPLIRIPPRRKTVMVILYAHTDLGSPYVVGKHQGNLKD